MCTTAEVIKTCAADKLQLNRATEDLLLVEIKSNGERTVFKDYDVSVPTGKKININNRKETKILIAIYL